MFLFGPCSVFMHKLLCFLAIVSSFWRKSITNHVPLTLTILVTGEHRVQPLNKHINSCLLPYKTKVHYYYCYCVSQAGAKSDPWPLICTFWWADSVHDGRGRGLAANILTNCKISAPDPRPPPSPALWSETPTWLQHSALFDCAAFIIITKKMLLL